MMLPCQFSETQILFISPHMNTEFEWDPIKAASNQQKHGVSFVEAATVFFDPLSLTVEDPLHSVSELRYVIIGVSYQGRLLVCGSCGSR
jgi:uncharacterized DUF497 family protein